MSPKEYKDLRKQIEKSCNRKFTAFEWFVLLIVVVLVIGIPVLAIVPQ